MKFNSQICTSREQSERLLALGLKKETADMHWRLQPYYNDEGFDCGLEWSCNIGTFLQENACELFFDYIPAWSLGRLLALGNGEDWNAEITLKDERYGIHTGFDTMWYDDIFEAVIAWIEEDIKEGYFNKEYLQEQAGSSREG